MRAKPVARGCGSRKEGGVYLECGLSPGGSPIENFLFDPPLTNVPTEWLQPHRNPILFERAGVWHVVIWVGAEFYPHVWDYIEEVRKAGSSRRVSVAFDFSKLTSESRQYFVHPGALADVDARLEQLFCPKLLPDGPLHVEDGPGVNCLGVSKYLPAPTPAGYKERVDPNDAGRRFRTLPCGHTFELYNPPTVMKPGGWVTPLMISEPAVFMQLPITGVCMVERRDGSFPEAVEARVSKAGVETFRTAK